MVTDEQFWRGVDLGLLLMATDVMLVVQRGGGLDEVLAMAERVREERC